MKKKNKILLGTLTPLGLLALIGGGLGIGYIIWYSNTPTFSFSTTQPLLTNVGDEFDINVTTNKSNVKYCLIQVDDTYTELFSGADPFLKFVGSSYINVSSSQPTLRASLFNNKKATFTIQCAKPLPSGEDTQFISYQILHFNKEGEEPNYLHDGHFIFQTDAPQMSSEEINNFQFKFATVWPSMPNLTDFTSWLQNDIFFSQCLPSGQAIAFSPSDSTAEVLNKLHWYDNSASMLALIISDVYNSIDTSITNFSTIYQTIGINVFGLISTTESDKYGVETQKFDLAFRQIVRGDYRSLTNEIVDDIFMTNDEAIGSNWQIHWDSWLHYHSEGSGGSVTSAWWIDKGSSTGVFTGMFNVYTGTFNVNMQQEIKAIYGNIVTAWPSGW